MSLEGIYDNIEVLPHGWLRSPLGEVLQVIRGASPRPKGDPKYFGGTIPWIMISDITREKGKFISQTKDHVTEAGALKSRLLNAGTLILSNSGTVCVPKILTVDGCIHDGFVAFPDLPEEFNRLFLYYYFDLIRPNIINSHRQGITQVNLNTSIVKGIQLPIAPLAQQTRIVAEIEKQFSRLDEAVANLKRVKVNLKRYKAAVLKAAVEGKLTEEWRRRHSTYESSDELPTGWTMVKLHKIADIVDPQPSHRTPPTAPNGIPYIGMGDIGKDGKIDLSGARKVSSDVLKEHRERYQLKKGDFIFGKIGTIGRPVRLTGPFEYTLSANVVLVQPKADLVESAFLFIYLASSLLEVIIREESRATTQAAFGIKRIRQVECPLPPANEQLEIIAEVERRLSIVAGVEAQVEANLRRADRLRQSILKQAFSGQLVPQDPNAEPASVLLERIRVTQPAQTKEPAARQRKHRTPGPKTAAPLPKPLPMVAEAFATYGDAIIASILSAMQPGREYARADLADPLGLTTGQWNTAIQELKRVGKVRQTGEKRGVRYSLV